MSQTPDCTCKHNLIDHADCWDEGEVEGVCLKTGCSCRQFEWDRMNGRNIVLSPFIAMSNLRSLSSLRNEDS